MDRTTLLCALGQTVILSNCLQHKKLIAYFSDYKIHHIGMAMGVRKLKNIIWETYDHNWGNLLGAFGELFPANVRFYIYPARKEGDDELITVHNIDIPPAIRHLYQHILENRHVTQVENFNPDILHVYHKKVLHMIQHQESGWEENVPPDAVRLIKEKRLFGIKH